MFTPNNRKRKKKKQRGKKRKQKLFVFFASTDRKSMQEEGKKNCSYMFTPYALFSKAVSIVDFLRMRLQTMKATGNRKESTTMTAHVANSGINGTSDDPDEERTQNM